VAVNAAAILPIIIASIVFGASDIASTVVAAAVIVATAMVAPTISTGVGLSRGDKTA
jgi:hypothetical protein